MEFSEEELAEVLDIFQQESEEQIQKLNDSLLRLESNPKDNKIIQDIFREAHSLKGAARMIGLDDIQTIAYKLEDIFGLARNDQLEIRPEVIDIMCNAVDSIAAIIEDTVKTKGTHSIDVGAIVNQLKLIESGEMNKFLASSVKQEEELEEEVDEEAEEVLVVSKKGQAPPAKPTSQFEFSDEELAEVLDIFQQESEEQIQLLNDNLLKLESNPQDNKIIQDIFREAHSLKGAARMIGLDDIQLIAHKLEDIFGLARNNQLEIRPEVIDIMCHAVDSIATIIEDTVKTKGTHSIDVNTIVNQLKFIETGEINNLLGAAQSQEEVKQEIFEPAFVDVEKEETVQEKQEGKAFSGPNSSQIDFSDEEFEEILDIFQQESEEQIQKLNDSLLRLESNPKDKKIIQDVFREAHSLKGAARMIGLDDVQTISHKLEDIFGLARNDELEIRPEVIDIMCNAVDSIATIIEDTVKTKGYHTIDVTSIVNQLKLIESGEMNKFFGAAIQPQKEELEDEKEESIEKLVVSVPEKAQIVEPEEEMKDFSDDEMSDLKQIFYVEGLQNVEFLLESVERLERFPYDREMLSEIYRSAHTLEGSCRLINFQEIREVTHHIRDIFDQAVKEEVFINSDLISVLKKDLENVKKIILTKQQEIGVEEQLNIEELEEKIDKRMESYRPKKDKPKRSSKPKISLSSDNFDFDEDDVLKDFGVKQEDIKPKELKPETKRQLEVDPLSLSDEELGDIQLGALQNLMPPKLPVMPDNEIPQTEKKEFINLSKAQYEEQKKEKPPVQKFKPQAIEPIKEKSQFPEKKKPSMQEMKPSVGLPSEVTKKVEVKPKAQTIEDINVVLNNLNEDLTVLSTNSENKNAIKNSIENVSKAKKLAAENKKHELLAIITKIETILEEVNDKKILLTNEIAMIMAQSVESIVVLANITEENKDEIVEDPSLIYQRLMILHQTSRLSAGRPFEEESEPEIFQQHRPERKEEVEEVIKSQPVKQKSKMVLDKKSEVQAAPAVASTESSLFDKKSTMSPIGEMSSSKQPAINDSTETYTIKTLRVDTRKLDQLVAQVGELIIAKIKAKERLVDIEKLLNILEEWQRDWARTKYAVKTLEKKPLKLKKSAFMAEGTSIYTPGKDMNAIIRENSDRLAQLTNHLNLLYRNIQEDDTRLTLIISELENRIKNVRLLPLSTIFNMYPRMVRDIARQQHKEIELEIRGSETTVDKKIIEEIKSPLMHLIRNAIDHGIETPADREKNQKLKAGKILLTARHLESSVLIEILDDGRGINIEAIKSKVLEKELLSPSELAAMTETQIMNVIFWPGFSTGKEITDISGRGVGMDVVHTKITQLNGKVKVNSRLGEGCRVSIQLPVTMATIQVFLISLGGQTYAIPTSAIKTAVLVYAKDVFYKEGRETILVGGIPVFLSNLNDLLELPKSNGSKQKREKMTVLVIQTEDSNIGFIVDGLLGDQEILHKNLDPPLVRVRNVAGVTTLGSGEVCLILNVGDLVKTAQMNQGMAIRTSYKKKEQSLSQKKDILVVDDSVTTRILERNILRAAGYNVTVAVNGLDALTKLTAQHFDLIVSDVEMPDINGYELTKRVKRDDILSDIPVVLVTSLASEVDKQKGLSAGASAYITKGGFDQEELLGTIRSLLA